MQGGNRDKGVENGRVGIGQGAGRWYELRDWDWHIYTAVY